MFDSVCRPNNRLSPFVLLLGHKVHARAVVHRGWKAELSLDQMCVNDLPSFVLDSAAAGIELANANRELANANRDPSTTFPPSPAYSCVKR